MGGDFNTIKDRRERKGRSMVVNYNELDSFTDFIQKSALVDISCKGKKFYWYSGDGKSISRIDRFLVSDIVVTRWGVVVKFLGIEIFRIIARSRLCQMLLIGALDRSNLIMNGFILILVCLWLKKNGRI